MDEIVCGFVRIYLVNNLIIDLVFAVIVYVIGYKI